MIGRATAGLRRPPRRWVQRWWGEPNVHSRQKWAAVWPHLARLPRDGVRLLDAGCADGAWSVEIATRRPGWTLLGIDRDRAALARADATRARLALPNVALAAADFLAFRPDHPFDVVLSISSAHYLVELGQGPALFGAVRDWLAPGGTLVLLVPRAHDEVPYAAALPVPFARRDVVRADALRALCAATGLRVERLEAVVGAPGTCAKQLERATAESRLLAAASYPVQLALTALDGWGPPLGPARRSAALVLVATRVGEGRA